MRSSGKVHVLFCAFVSKFAKKPTKPCRRHLFLEGNNNVIVDAERKWWGVGVGAGCGHGSTSIDSRDGERSIWDCSNSIVFTSLRF